MPLGLCGPAIRAAGFFAGFRRNNRFTARTRCVTSLALFWITASAPVLASFSPSVSTKPETSTMPNVRLLLSQADDQLQRRPCGASCSPSPPGRTCAGKIARAHPRRWTPRDLVSELFQHRLSGARSAYVVVHQQNASMHAMEDEEFRRGMMCGKQRDSNRAATQLSRIFYRTQKRKDGVLDFFISLIARECGWMRNLFDWLGRGVTRLREDLVLHRLALLVLDRRSG